MIGYINSVLWELIYEMLVPAIQLRFRIAEVPVPTRYFAEASSPSFKTSVIYRLSILAWLTRCFWHRHALLIQKQFECFPARYKRDE